MPTPRLRSTDRQFFCTLCKTQLKTDFRWPKKEDMSAKATKQAVFNEWDEHLRIAHPRQWEREQRKRARRRAAAEPYAFPNDNGIEGQ
jgi:hypothetical protein